MLNNERAIHSLRPTYCLIAEQKRFYKAEPPAGAATFAASRSHAPHSRLFTLFQSHRWLNVQVTSRAPRQCRRVDAAADGEQTKRSSSLRLGERALFGHVCTRAIMAERKGASRNILEVRDQRRAWRFGALTVFFYNSGW